MTLDLFEKTEITISPLVLKKVNLDLVAEVTAGVLQISPDMVWVIDAREDLITLDILSHDLLAENVFGKGKELLTALNEIPGLTILETTLISSRGILGNLCMDPEEGSRLADNSGRIAETIVENIRRRVLVFPSGEEILSGKIEDTNSPLICEVFRELGCKAEIAEPISDKLQDAILRISEAVDNGYGVIITTGGVGAEAKDVNVEAMTRIADEYYTPDIIRFTAGEGRHVRGSVRIGVGRAGASVIMNLPGPHSEVKACMPLIRDWYLKKTDISCLSQALAEVLRKIWANKIDARHAMHGHHSPEH